MIYLNAAGTSWPKAPLVPEAMRAALEEEPEAWPRSFEEAHRRVARALGIAETSRLLLTPGCTSALAVAVADHHWGEGDRIVISGMEHHALHRPAQKLVGLGVELRVIGRAEPGPLDLAALEGALREGGVRLVALSAASSLTGELLPFREARELAHRYGALFLLDAAQLAGWLPLDVEELGVDLLAFAGHKALQGPWGIGGLYVRPGLSMASPAATCEAPAAGGEILCAPMPGYCDVGSVDRAALAGLRVALAWLGSPQREGRLERARALVERLCAGLLTLEGVRLYGDRRPERRLPTVAFEVEGRDPTALGAALRDSGLLLAAGTICAPLALQSLGASPQGLLRASVGPQTEETEIDRALSILRKVLKK